MCVRVAEGSGTDDFAMQPLASLVGSSSLYIERGSSLPGISQL